jgi:hypothetical protein
MTIGIGKAFFWICWTLAYLRLTGTQSEAAP